jgi:hypothetical protein
VTIRETLDEKTCEVRRHNPPLVRTVRRQSVVSDSGTVFGDGGLPLAALLFGDVDQFADPKRTDPDRRNLLLAGNRKGTVVAVKEPLRNGRWNIRYVNAYCARLFTAILLPDPVLASRTIVIPLVRTADPKKANAEVLNDSLWPCDRKQLLDDLWALALANLARIPAHVAAVDAPLTGRTLEPWKGILAVAHWLEAEGRSGCRGGCTSWLGTTRRSGWTWRRPT